MDFNLAFLQELLANAVLLYYYASEPGAVDVYAVVVPDPRALLGPAFEFGVILDVG